jgi:hypothetical protein
VPLKRTRSSWIRSSSLGNNASLAKASEDDAARQLRRHKFSLLQSVFALSEEDITSNRWPGARTYLKYVCEQLEDLYCGDEHPVLTLLGHVGPADLGNLLKFVTVVANVLRTSGKDGASISEVFDNVLEEFGIDPDSDAISSNVRHAGHEFVFAIIGWLTMLYKPVKPKPNDPGFYLHVDEKQVGVKAHLANEVAKRPIAGLLRALGNILPHVDQGLGQGTSHVHDQRSVLIQISALNFYALKTIAKINIQWVDCLSAHLEFHPLSRTLLLFRFPSFCALNCKEKEDGLCFNRYGNLSKPTSRARQADIRYRVLDEYYHDAKSANKSSLVLATYKREVILSYRLLFGQTQRSRKLFASQESKVASGEENKFSDPLLERLCHQRASELRTLPNELWPHSCRDPNGNLLEQDVYSIETDFPVFGQRLLTLQAFSLRQSPSRIKDMWRDRRNPVQWLTLWAVLLVGGISLLLQVIQIILSSAQLALQLQQSGV